MWSRIHRLGKPPCVILWYCNILFCCQHQWYKVLSTFPTKKLILKQHTRKTKQTISQTCIKIHKNLQNINLCSRFSNHQKFETTTWDISHTNISNCVHAKTSSKLTYLSLFTIIKMWTCNKYNFFDNYWVLLCWCLHPSLLTHIQHITQKYFKWYNTFKLAPLFGV
jgi:hypothetical protein